MTILSNFFIAFFFSFVGTIPPGTINLSILQLGLERKIQIAWRFSIAAALIEYPYAWLAVKFERIITSSPFMVDNIQLITAVVMTVLGLFNLWSARKPSAFSQKFNNSGFRRGFILGVLNPLALPFWVGTTAYLNSQRWIDLSTPVGLHAYLFGISLGALAFFIPLALLAKKIVTQFRDNKILNMLPGIILLALGIYAFIQYLF